MYARGKMFLGRSKCNQEGIRTKITTINEWNILNFVKLKYGLTLGRHQCCFLMPSLSLVFGTFKYSLFQPSVCTWLCAYARHVHSLKLLELNQEMRLEHYISRFGTYISFSE